MRRPPPLPVLGIFTLIDPDHAARERTRLMTTTSPRRGGTAAVFGAGGKLGRHVLAALARRGFAVRVLVHRTPVSGPNVVSVAGSIADPAAVDTVVRGADVVIQLATAKEDSATFFDVSVRGTFNVLEACRRQKIRQFILFGGDAALGIWFYPQPIPIDENHPRAAYPGHYAFSKVMEEVMAEQYSIQYGVPFTVLRSSWVFEDGDLLKHFSLLHNVRPAEKGHGFGEVSEATLALVRAGQERIPVLTDAHGTPLRRHVVHVDDVIQAFDRLLENPSALGQTFNIAGPAAFDYRVAADYISRRRSIPIVELRCPDYHSFEINITRARTLLGYAPENDIFRMADRAIAFTPAP
ncbi:NAD-dependent epimerase/dehydratase family protein [Horticoccus sp. 23ND18S-11]